MDSTEPTRTRRQGTEVVQTTSGAERVAACQRIVDRRQYGKIDGLMIDTFTASAIVKVHAAVNDANRAKFEALPIAKMGRVALQLIG